MTLEQIKMVRRAVMDAGTESRRRIHPGGEGGVDRALHDIGRRDAGCCRARLAAKNAGKGPFGRAAPNI